MMINGIKFLLISAVVPLLFLIPSFNIYGFGVVNDVPQDLEYGINFKYPKTWEHLPDIDTNDNDDLSTTSYLLAQKDSIYNYKGKTFYGYLISIKVIDDLLAPPTSSEQWAKNQIIGISEQSITYRLIEPSDPNGELVTLPISQGEYNGYTYTIEDKTTQKVKVNTVLVLDNKRYEFEYTSPNTNNEVSYRYIDDYKEILNSVKFTG